MAIFNSKLLVYQRVKISCKIRISQSLPPLSRILTKPRALAVTPTDTPKPRSREPKTINLSWWSNPDQRQRKSFYIRSTCFSQYKKGGHRSRTPGHHGSSWVMPQWVPHPLGLGHPSIKPTNIPMMPMAANGRRPILSMYLIKASGHEDKKHWWQPGAQAERKFLDTTLAAAFGHSVHISHSMTVSARTAKRAINIITLSGNLQ